MDSVLSSPPCPNFIPLSLFWVFDFFCAEVFALSCIPLPLLSTFASTFRGNRIFRTWIFNLVWFCPFALFPLLVWPFTGVQPSTPGRRAVRKGGGKVISAQILRTTSFCSHQIVAIVVISVAKPSVYFFASSFEKTTPPDFLIQRQKINSTRIHLEFQLGVCCFFFWNFYCRPFWRLF